MPDLRALLADGHVHVTDGAMGTMLYSKGLFLNVCYDELNLSQPDVIRDVHREYVRAGAEVIETNTFGANPIKLAQHGLTADTETINAAAARIARDAAGSAPRWWAPSAPWASASSRLGRPRSRRPGRPSRGRRLGSWPAASTDFFSRLSATWRSCGAPW